ncbi:hypothetical protein KKH46_00175 [Patescibacteria group bacterium]|nr:hypothetical protein [Patescibacteria group bacterium]MBU1730035.1 hypothetical protein [Patescibacteria group bacterium]MBU1956244.1 hypothetical protein [Patescibacteria group bacterium]MBU2010104.1 hypothetical protein [Patescibacteria group bacterium]
MKIKNRKIIGALIITISSLSFAYFVSAEDGLWLDGQKLSSNTAHSFDKTPMDILRVEYENIEETRDNTSDENDIPTISNSEVFVKVIKEYCNKKNEGFGEVEFSLKPDTEATFQVFGKELSGASASYTFHSGKHQLPTGEYKWSVLPVTFNLPKPSDGYFNIKIKCVSPEITTSQKTSEEISEETKKDTNDFLDKDNSKKEEKENKPTILPTQAVLRGVLNGTHRLFLETQDAVSIEWYITRDPGNTQEYLGAAVFNTNENRWEYSWDTTQVPNGDYVLIPQIKSKLNKKYKHTPSFVTVKNEKQKIDNDIKISAPVLIEKIKKESPQIALINEQHKNEEVHITKEIIKATAPYYQEVEKKILEREEVKKENKEEDKEEKKEEVVLQKTQLTKEKEKSEKYIEKLIEIESTKLLDGVLRNDEAQKTRTKEKIIVAVTDLLERADKIAEEAGVAKTNQDKEMIQRMREVTLTQTNKLANKLEKVMKEKKEVLSARVQEDIFNDSDKDGISNYDEVNIYNTDPANVDSDGDGYVDGAEILGGFDPTQPAVEATIEYEEPIETGYEEETFSVQNIVVVETKTDEMGVETIKKVSIQGTALANSFVTLYIYSTPIIVTVKTDENGNWSYELDKELEDGKHEVYVALTDNGGKIFAKSKAFPFVKQALAITVGGQALTDNTAEDVNIFDQGYLYVVGLIILVIIGWVLIFIGSKRAKLEDNVIQ